MAKFNEKQKADALDEIFDRIGKGESTVSIMGVNRLPHLPNRQTFTNWLDNSEIEGTGLLDRYARANQLRQDVLLQEIFDISDDTKEDFYIDETTGKRLTNHEAIQRSRLRVDIRKWALSKMNPTKFGDKVDLTTNGKEVNATPPIVIKIDGVDIRLQ